MSGSDTPLTIEGRARPIAGVGTSHGGGAGDGSAATNGGNVKSGGAGEGEADGGNVKSALSGSEFAAQISRAWQASVEAIFETGRLIVAAKAALKHGEFQAMIEADLPFGKRYAQMLMQVAEHRDRLTMANRGAHLPPSARTLYELTRLDDPALEARFADNTIHPGMERADIATIVKRENREKREVTLAAKQKALPKAKFGVIYADPEWRFAPYSRETGMDRAAANHYSTSDLADIKARPVADIAADDCVLFLWATAPMLPQALEVMTAWGFAYKSHFIWHKKGKLGTGYWNRNMHEMVLVGTRGAPVAPAMGEQWPSILSEEPKEHSAKPTCFYELIETYFPNLPKIELNARRARDGWTAWGNEAPEHSTSEDTSHGGGAGDGSNATNGGIKQISGAGDGSQPDGVRPQNATNGGTTPAQTYAALTAAHVPSVPYRSTLEGDQLIGAAYALDPVPLDEVAATMQATKLQVRRRANQLGLGSRDRQKKAAADWSRAHGGKGAA